MDKVSFKKLGNYFIFHLLLFRKEKESEVVFLDEVYNI